MTVHIKILGNFTERKRNPPYGMSESIIWSGNYSRLRPLTMITPLTGS